MSNIHGRDTREPSLYQALIPPLFLAGLLTCSIRLFGNTASDGPNQIALILAAGVTIIIGLLNGHRWKELENGIIQGISLAMGAILILLVVGSLIGSWILAGIVPTMIYYGLKILIPSVFYAAACVICALVSLVTGSSWTTAGTIGVALIGIATAQDLNLGLAAGAILSGAYFGDKMSPLSETTNLAPAVSGTNLFAHIRHMIWTTAPSITLALILFVIAGLFSTNPQNKDNLDPILRTLENQFEIGPHLLIPVVFVFILVIRKIPAFPALLLGTLVGGLFAVLFQHKAVLTYVGETDLPTGWALLQGVWMVFYGGFELHSGNALLDDLLSGGGMSSMLLTVWLVISAMMFGAVLETTRMLQTIGAAILSLTKGTGSLIFSTLLTCIGTNMLAADQYISIVLPGRLFRVEYQKRQIESKNLSRALEDGGTLTSVLIPWNTCGVFMSQTLGVTTLVYAPYCFFNLINLVVATIYSFTGSTTGKLPKSYPDGKSSLV